jgi:hypothetical protein
MSAISERSTRLRSRCAVVLAAHRAGRSRASVSSCSREGLLDGTMCESGFGVFEVAELLFSSFSRPAGDQAVVGLAGVEGALGADRVVAGAFDAQLERAVGARSAVLELVGGGQCERDLLRRERGEQSVGDELDDPGRAFIERQAAF